MTKKDFRLIAEIIDLSWFLTADQKQTLAQAFAERLKVTNPRFNRHKFMEACMSQEYEKLTKALLKVD